MVKRWVGRVGLSVCLMGAGGCAPDTFAQGDVTGGNAKVGGGADGDSDAGAADATTPEASATGDATADADPGFPCDPSATPSPASLFVAPFGTDSPSAGSASAPFRTLTFALSRATKGATIALGEGTYEGGQTISAATDGVAILGGWTGAWTRDCSAGVRERTVIASSSPIGLTVAGAAASLSHLSITASDASPAAADASGASSYGILATNVTTLTLDDVVIAAGNASAGGAATKGVAPGNVSCGGVSDCSASPMHGADGPSGTAGSGGSYDAWGFRPGDGNPGGSGASGDNGVAGGASTGTWNTACVYDVDAMGCITDAPVGTGAGHCGCGGMGGSGGGAGRGGGASIAVFVSGGSASLSHTKLQAKSGGAGSSGALGVAGGVGATGSSGSSVKAATSCSKSGTICKVASSAIEPGGSAGGSGAAGGRGGDGSAGAGGDSYDYVTVGATLVDDGLTELVTGAAGAGLPAGHAGPHE